MVREMDFAGLEDGGKGPQAKDARGLQPQGKAETWILPRVSRKRQRPARALVLAQGDSGQTPDQ